jgi:hypothetical protein
MNWNWSIALLVGALVAMPGAARAAEPATCSEAYRACVKPVYGHCDPGCASTCRLRLEGCLKTGSFSTPRGLIRNLKRR